MNSKPIEDSLIEWNGYGAYVVLTAQDYERVVSKLTDLELLEVVLGKEMTVLQCFVDIPEYDDVESTEG
jgi:hypothetical protein